MLFIWTDNLDSTVAGGAGPRTHTAERTFLVQKAFPWKSLSDLQLDFDWYQHDLDTGLLLCEFL